MIGTAPQVDELVDVLAVWLTPGVGPLRMRALLERFGSAAGVRGATAGAMTRVPGIGRPTAEKIARGLAESEGRAREQIGLAQDAGVAIVTPSDAGYPALLGALPDAPPVLFIKGGSRAEAHGGEIGGGIGRGVAAGAGGRVDCGAVDAGPVRYPVAIVGSRSATLYGLEQAARFGGALAHAGLSVVSGGARGVDTAAHKAALKAGGRTVAVLGCGLLRAYPEENAALFDEIAASGGAVISELPMNAEPKAEHFPARNRLISGMSLGVLVIEAGKRSGALITARIAAEDHGREVMALPGRVDSPSSWGTLDLLRQGGAALVMEPSDVVHTLEQAARLSHEERHADRYPAAAQEGSCSADIDGKGEAASGVDQGVVGLTGRQAQICGALSEAMTPDALALRLGIGIALLRSELTLLELSGRVRRSGSRVERVAT